METKTIIYKWNGNIEEENFEKFLAFYNECLANNVTDIELYLCSDGGSSDTYAPLLDLLNNGVINVTLIGYEFLGSYTALLFYFFTGAKKLLPMASMMFHLIDMNLSVRADIKRDDPYHKHNRNVLDSWNKYVTSLLKENKIFKEKYLKKLEKGTDVFLTHEQTIELLLECSYGTFVR